MIYVLVHRHNAHPVHRLVQTAPSIARFLKPLSYQRIFRRGWCPRGTLVFTDLDLLNSFEADVAAGLGKVAENAGSPVLVLNHPGRALERFSLLRRLHRHGLNPVDVVRLDSEELPPRYPVFLRSEDGALGPETGLLNDQQMFLGAVAALVRDGKTLKRRIAVTFESERDSSGFYRKYGALVIGKRIIPQHILRSLDWNVKSTSKVADEAFAREEVEYVFENPHGNLLLPIAELCGIDFGRVDYTLRDGKPIVFEINTNPMFPRFIGGDPTRQQRRDFILRQLLEALSAIDTVQMPGKRLAVPAGTEGAGHLINRAAWCEDPRGPFERRTWVAMRRQIKTGLARLQRAVRREARGR